MTFHEVQIGTFRMLTMAREACRVELLYIHYTVTSRSTEKKISPPVQLATTSCQTVSHFDKLVAWFITGHICLFCCHMPMILPSILSLFRKRKLVLGRTPCMSTLKGADKCFTNARVVQLISHQKTVVVVSIVAESGIILFVAAR